MRILLVVLAWLSFAMSTSAVEGASAAAAEARAVNNVCPVTGRKVDGSILPIAAVTRNGATVLIGVADKASADAVKQDPAAYLEAAVANRQRAKP
jgi:hypothetical protein